MTAEVEVDVSIIIVNYNVRYFAEQCLKSVYAAQGDLNIETFLVDNASSDQSVEHLTPLFPEVNFIANTENIGFGRANNIALKLSKGKYLLVLNPDTILQEDSLSAMIQYLEDNPKAGVIGPKILNRYGGFDITSKRGLPTPWVAFCRVSGLSALFPKSPTFGRYDLLYMDEDSPNQVDSLVGSCMMVRKQVYDEVGGFDEMFFMYGEDIDWSYRIKLAGWEVHYAPITKIVHFRGESTRRSKINRDKAFYGAMHMFVDKHFRKKYSWFGHQLINFGIAIAWMAARLRALRKRITWQSIDWIGLWLIMVSGRWVRTWDLWVQAGWGKWLSPGITGMVALAITIQSTVWVLSFYGVRAYHKNRGSTKFLLWGLTLGFLVNSSFTYFFQQFAYSRFVTLFGFIVGGVFVIGWRLILNFLFKTKSWNRYLSRRALIVGVGENGKSVYNNLKTNTLMPYDPVGFIDPAQQAAGGMINELPVLGGENEIERIVELEGIEEILFAYDNFGYDHIFELISKIGNRKNVDFKIITPDNISDKDSNLPLLSIEYLTPRGIKGSIKKISSLIQKG